MENAMKFLKAWWWLVVAVPVLAGSVSVGKSATRWAAGTAGLEEKIAVVEERLEQKIETDTMDDLQERMWKLEDRHRPAFKEEYGRTPKDINELVEFMPDEDRKRYRSWKKQYDDLDAKRKARSKKKGESG